MRFRCYRRFGLLWLIGVSFSMLLMGCQASDEAKPIEPPAAVLAQAEPGGEASPVTVVAAKGGPAVTSSLRHGGISLDLDGTPVHGEYTMTLAVGTPPQEFEVVMDSGSSNLILKGMETQLSGTAECQAIEMDGNVFDASTSSTVKKLTQAFDLQYGSGRVSAHEMEDVVAVAGSQGFVYPFALMTYDKCVPNILGLAYDSLAQPRGAEATPLRPWFDALVAETGIDDMFSMLLCGPQKGGQIELGGASVVPQSYLPITEEKCYVIAPDHLAIQGQDGVLGKFEVTTIVDSGTTELLLSPEMYAGVLAAVKKAALAAGVEFGALTNGQQGLRAKPADLSAFPTFEVVAGTARYQIAPETYLTPLSAAETDDSDAKDSDEMYLLAVAPAFQASTPAESQTIILGQVFMENYHVVFDRAKKRLGFTPSADLCQHL